MAAVGMGSSYINIPALAIHRPPTISAPVSQHSCDQDDSLYAGIEPGSSACRCWSMALLQNRDACKSWTSLLVTVSQMVDWVHFTTTHDTFHQVVSPKIWEAVNKLSGIYADEESTVDLATELKQLLMEHSWNGRSFAQDVSAVNLLSALKSFKLKCERPLGKGAYAKVFLSRSQLTDEVVVHKHVQIDSPEHGLPLHVLRELAILQKMRHPHIVRLHDVLYRETEVVLTLEYMDCNLRELLRNSGPLNIVLVKSFTHQILQGVAYAKAKRCVHRDLKPANILVAPRYGIVKLADYGLGRAYDFSGGKYTRQVMTLRYRAPEIMLGVREYSAAVDMWSVGCIMAEMVRGDTPFKGENEIDQLLKIFELLGRPCPEEWPEVQQGENFQTCFPRWPRPSSLSHLAPGLDEDGLDLLTKMLVYNPQKRISADEALQHPWFHDVQLPQEAQAEAGQR
eukprot:jgi/Ulvmu1/2473/UM136_0025.1